MIKATKLLLKRKGLILFLKFILFIATVVFSFNLYYQDRIFPGIIVSGIRVGGMTKTQAETILSENIRPPEKMSILAKNRSFELSLKDVISYDLKQTTETAFNFYRSGDLIKDNYNRAVSHFSVKNIPIKIDINEEALDEYLQVISSQISTEPKFPSVFLEENEIVIDKGSAGESIDTTSFKKTFEEHLASRDYSSIEVPFKKNDPTLGEEEAGILRLRAEKLLGKNLSIVYDYQTLLIDNEDVFLFLDPKQEFNQQKISDYIRREIAPKLNHEPQDAVFRFENGKVIEFLPSKEGITVNEKELGQDIIKSLRTLETSEEKSVSIQVPVHTARPKVTNEEVNNLGIKELIGRGVSKFRGSISTRIHNISLASSKFNGILVAPGDTFSFNKTLGDVSSFTGYKQAYVIRDGRTVLGDGGGVCQVSTTLFRALLKAGLPIIERRAHSYRVGYYEQESPPGLDATVFDPTTDLKFKNDTPAHILIQTIFDAKTSTLIFEIYGTNDGRVATTTKPVVTSVVPPPEDLYQDDPAIPSGTTKQIDYKAWGAKVTFNYRVERNGETIYEKTFLSNYRPWQAVFLRGTGPVN